MSSYTDPSQAIDRSISHDEIAVYEGALDALLSAASDQDYETDYARENDGAYDVWGWTNQQAEGEMAWRVRVVTAEA